MSQTLTERAWLDVAQVPHPKRKMVWVFAPRALEEKSTKAAYCPRQKCWFGEDGYAIKQLNKDGWTENAEVTHWRPIPNNSSPQIEGIRVAEDRLRGCPGSLTNFQ